MEIKNTKNTTAKSFDFIKGFTLCGSVFFNAVAVFGGASLSTLSSLAFVPLAFAPAVIAMFLYALGFNCETEPPFDSINECIKRVFVSLLCIVIIASILHYQITMRFFYPDKAEALKIEHIRFVSGQLLGYTSSIDKGGLVIYECSTTWVLYALGIGLLLFKFIRLLPEKFAGIGATICALLGWFIGRFEFIPFCIPQALIACFFIYIGYALKKKSFLEKKAPWWFWILFILSLIGILADLAYFREINNMARNLWHLGPLSIILYSISGIGFMRIFVRISKVSNFIVKTIESLGKNSATLHILFMIELLITPWQYIYPRFFSHPLRGMAAMFIIHILITAVYYLIYTIGAKLFAKLKKQMIESM